MKRKILISFLAVIFSVSQCFADGGGTTVFNFLKMPLNAQVASMAGISSIFVSAAALNPSLIAFSEKPVLSAAYAFHFQNVNYNSLSFSYPFKKFGMNITYGGMNYGHIDSFIESNGDYEYNGSVNADDAFVSVGIGKEITENILLGASAKYVWQKIDDSSIDGIAFSFSGTYLFSDYTFYFSGGVENIGPKVDEYDLPSSVFVDFVDSLSDFIPFSYAVGLRAYFDNTLWFKAAGEYALHEMFVLRGGYSLPLNNANDTLGDWYQKNLSVGFGFEYGFLKIDYAWLPFGNLGSTSMFSLSVSF